MIFTILSLKIFTMVLTARDQFYGEQISPSSYSLMEKNFEQNWKYMSRLMTKPTDAQADLSLRWAHSHFCWFCHLKMDRSTCQHVEQEITTFSDNFTWKADGKQFEKHCFWYLNYVKCQDHLQTPCFLLQKRHFPFQRDKHSSDLTPLINNLRENECFVHFMFLCNKL